MKPIFYWLYRWSFRVIAYLSRRFTPAGYFLLALLVLAAIFGADTTLAMVFQIFTFVAFLLLIAFLLSLRIRGSFDVQRKLPRFVTAGLPFKYDISIKNPFNRHCTDLYIIDEFERSQLTYPEFSRYNPTKVKMCVWRCCLYAEAGSGSPGSQLRVPIPSDSAMPANSCAFPNPFWCSPNAMPCLRSTCPAAANTIRAASP
jgi:hypothetical protein